MTAVELKNVRFAYKEGLPVLDGVDFFAEYGKITLLSGMSGEGKSTLLSLIAGIIPNMVEGELHGEVTVAGASVKEMKTAQICRRVGCVLQNAELQIVFDVTEDEVAFGCENLAMPEPVMERRVAAACAMMELDPRSKTRTLSGGQKQRLITAATLSMGQKIIVLDEPLANLDKEGTHTLMTALGKLAARGYCVIISEHRLDMVMAYADEVWNIARGKVTRVCDRRAYFAAQAEAIVNTCPAPEQSAPLLSLRGVEKSFGKRLVLKGIDLDVFAGERLLILGQNGCGKTTLMRVLARLERADRGEIRQFIDKKAGRRAGKRWFAQVGVVYQNPNYQLFMPTVRREIEFGAQSREYAREIIEMFDLRELENRHPQSLSEGQKRRVSIAAVVASRPKLLLLDEPTVGQDLAGLQRLTSVLTEIHRRDNNTMITVTHDMRPAQALCDRAVFMEAGKIERTGGREDVKKYFEAFAPPEER